MSFFSRPESVFAPPSFAYIAIYHPIYTLFSFLHSLFVLLRGAPYTPPRNRIPIRVTCISDTHTKIPPHALPKGDLLIHAGDLTNLGTLAEIQQHIDWLKTLQKTWPGSSEGFRYIIAIAGNHDSYFDPRSRSAHDKRMEKSRKLDWGKIIYLEHSSVTVPFPGDRKLKIYGAPQIPACGGKEFAFQYRRGHDAWTETVPQDVDVLVTHNPPKWHLDIPENGGLGDEYELAEVWQRKPTLHVFGHVHSGSGKEAVWWDAGQKDYEALRERVFGGKGVSHDQGESLLRAMGEYFDIGLWTLGIKILVSDVKGLLWNRLWGGARNGGWMINAALTYQTTNHLGNRPKTVVL